MKSNRFLSLAVKPFLFLLEYMLKFSAGVIAAITLGGQGPFLAKIATGFGSFFNVIQRIMIWADNLTHIMTVVEDYNTLTAAAFNQRYGGQAINQVMASLNEGVAYMQAVYQNLTVQPFVTIIATFISFITFYAAARIVRFVRQRGKGSYIVRKEREIGDRFFRSSDPEPDNPTGRGITQ